MSRNDTVTRALFDLIQGEEGQQWAKTRKGWNDKKIVCNWEGIICDPQGEVNAIDLSYSGISGSIPPSLSNITSLRRISLSNNKLHGTVPLELGLLSHLVELDLSSNRLNGPLPPITSSNTIESVNLSNNQFTGTIHHHMLGNRTVIFNLAENELSGTIPESVGAANALTQLNLSRNQLDGSIPMSLWSLEGLESVLLDHNKLVGTLPASFRGRSMSLATIALHSNYLSGTIPRSFAFLEYLSMLLLDDNKLTGTVPDALCERDLNDALFEGTGLGDYYDTPDTDDAIGVIDIGLNAGGDDGDDNDDLFAGFGGKRSRGLELYNQNPSTIRDGCNSIACPAGYRSIGSKDGAFPCQKCGDDYYNPYLGAHRCLPNDERTLLDFIHFELVGPDWVGGADSWRDDAVKTCDREGITCNNNGHVTKIDLKGMNLVGALPEEIGFFRYLEHLDLADNHLSGTIPSSLHFPPLHTLDLTGNTLTGDVPSVLCKKHGVNGNGYLGVYTCDAIACAVGSFNALGFADLHSDYDRCFQCVHGGEAVSYLGSTDCILRPLSKAGPESETSSSRTRLSDPVRLLLIALAMFLFFGYCYFRGRAADLKRLNMRSAQKTKQLEDDEDEDEDNMVKKSMRTQHTSIDDTDRMYRSDESDTVDGGVYRISSSSSLPRMAEATVPEGSNMTQHDEESPAQVQIECVYDSLSEADEIDILSVTSNQTPDLSYRQLLVGSNEWYLQGESCSKGEPPQDDGVAPAPTMSDCASSSEKRRKESSVEDAVQNKFEGSDQEIPSNTGNIATHHATLPDDHASLQSYPDDAPSGSRKPEPCQEPQNNNSNKTKSSAHSRSLRSKSATYGNKGLNKRVSFCEDGVVAGQQERNTVPPRPTKDESTLKTLRASV